MIVTLQSRNTITIPRELRQSLCLEPGDPLEAQIEQGKLVLTPVVSSESRPLRLTETGQAKEAEADDDIRQGRLTEYASAPALLDDLYRSP